MKVAAKAELSYTFHDETLCSEHLNLPGKLYLLSQC
jgi:hypothetical protein